MSLKLALLLALLAASAGIGFGYLLRILISLGRKGSMELDIQRLELASREEAKQIIEEAESRAEAILKSAHQELKERETRLKAGEDRIIKKEETLDKRQSDIDREAEQIKVRAAEVRALKDRIEKLADDKVQELSKVANFSSVEAKNELMRIIERDFEEDFLVKMKKLETQSSEKIEKRAKEILATAIQRLSSSISGEVMATSIPLSSDDLKGKIIGKEGRNIRAFERATALK